MISVKTHRSLSSASTRFFRAVSDIFLSTDAASTVDFMYHHCDNNICIKNLAMRLLLMHIKTVDKKHEEAHFEIQIM
jgi:hypothetical protein